MYVVDNADKVVEVSDLPQGDVGHPCPAVIATERKTFLVYYLNVPFENEDGTSLQNAKTSSESLDVAVISLDSCLAHMFGPPDDETFDGHPLDARGLAPYNIFEVRNSSWIRSLERINSVHPLHDPARFEKYRHFIFLFNNITFECVTEGFDCRVQTGSVFSTLEELARNIE